MECTWDEDDVKRAQVTRKKITEDEIEKLNLENYLASDSDDGGSKSSVHCFLF